MEASGRQRLIPWLRRNLDDHTIPGLVWENKDEGMFRIPWARHGKTDWREEDGAVFRAWAEYTGKYKPNQDETDWPTWKTRLRCALNKAPNICEVPDRHNTVCKGPYKVYQFKNKNKAVVKSEAPIPIGGEVMIPQSVINQHDERPTMLYSNDCQSEQLPTMTHQFLDQPIDAGMSTRTELPVEPMNVEFFDTSNQPDALQQAIGMVGLGLQDTNNLDDIDSTFNSQLPGSEEQIRHQQQLTGGHIIATQQGQQNTGVNILPAQNEAIHLDNNQQIKPWDPISGLEFEEILIPTADPCELDFLTYLLKTEEQAGPVEEWNMPNQSSEPANNLTTASNNQDGLFELQICYLGKSVWSSKETSGCLIYSSSTLEMEMGLKDRIQGHQPIHLPDASALIQEPLELEIYPKLLDTIVRGLNIECDNGDLFATRYCKCKIYCMSYYHEGPISLERKVRTKIYDYNDRFRNDYQHYMDNQARPKPDAQVFIGFGEKWSFKSDNTKIRIAGKITSSKALKSLEELYSFQTSNLLKDFDMSDNDEEDEVIEKERNKQRTLQELQKNITLN